jgi:hypothetical protein
MKIKQFISEDYNRIIYLLEQLGCNNIKKRAGYITCSQPDGDNPVGISIMLNENLTTKMFTRDDGISDIIGLIEYIKKCNFKSAIKYVKSVFNLDDSYTMLAYLSGNLNSTPLYPITSTLFGGMNLTANASTYSAGALFDNTFTPTENTNIINFYHGFNGDVDLSHSAIPVTPVSNVSGRMTTNSFAPKTLTSMSLSTPEVSNLDIVSRLVGGKVELSINTTKTGLAGIQINVNYDTNILQFDEVKFDTGNTMTNFANNKDGKIFVGSLDIKGASTVKVGTPYRLIFTPKQPITNTAGLINFGITEGVKTDGTKVKFNIQ